MVKSKNIRGNKIKTRISPDSRDNHIAFENTEDLQPSFATYKTTASRNFNQDFGNSGGEPINGELNNLSVGVTPYDSNQGTSVKLAIELCQKAYWNVPIFRSTIDIQSEFSNSELFFIGTNKKSKSFFAEWYKKIKGPSFADRFFKEWFRSGSVFVYSFAKDLDSKFYSTGTIPFKYIILNPSCIKCKGNSSFDEAEYIKILNEYEISKLKAPQTKEEKDFIASLDDETKKKIAKGDKNIEIPLDRNRLSSVFCGKQDYEPMAIPMYYSVLPDIDLKLEFKKAEKVIARTVDYAILLITAGSKEREEKESTAKLNNKLISALTDLFASEDVGRVLVSDYTTKANFVIPDLNQIFGSEKYKTVNEDISNGLMNIFWGEEKFANSMVKIRVFLERLNSARNAYLNEFLIPQMETIAKNLGMQSIPKPEFKEIDLKDEVEYMKIYLRLAELGFLTPAETFEALDSHKLPLPDNSEESQRQYKDLLEEGLYTPALNKAPAEKGRPAGTKAPQSTKNVKPIGASDKYSLSKISNCISKFNILIGSVEKFYKEFHDMQRLSKPHKEICYNIAESIVANETIEEWENQIEKYIKNPLNLESKMDSVLEISEQFGVDTCLSAILSNSKI